VPNNTLQLFSGPALVHQYIAELSQRNQKKALPAIDPGPDLADVAIHYLEELRTRQALEAAVGDAMDVVSARDARGWFQHSGYAVTPD
jgi:hypothetical protein